MNLNLRNEVFFSEICYEGVVRVENWVEVGVCRFMRVEVLYIIG